MADYKEVKKLFYVVYDVDMNTVDIEGQKLNVVLHRKFIQFEQQVLN